MSNIIIPDNIFGKWQAIVNQLAMIFNVPSSLIMRAHPKFIEVFAASDNEGNPYEKGETAELQGLYCKHVMDTNKMLLVPNALEDPVWDHNPDIKLNMISYLGYPVRFPDGRMFGTICVLDKKTNSYNYQLIELLKLFRDMIESNLALIKQNHELEEAMQKITMFEKILPVCAYCKKIKADNNTWEKIEYYASKEANLRFERGLCPECYEQEMQKLDDGFAKSLMR